MTQAATSDRVATGVPGFDKLIENGFIKGSTYLVAGQTGTGKSIFSMQYLMEGLRKGESCVYLTLEQKIQELLGDMSKFGWGAEMKKYYDAGKLLIVSAEPTSMKELQDTALAYISKAKASRFVLDSLTVAAYGWKISSMDLGKVRGEVFTFLRSIESSGVTSILISEIPEGEEKRLSSFGFEEFIADGVIRLNYIGIGSADFSTLEIRKMRRTDHSRGLFPLSFTKDGLRVGSQNTVMIR